MTRGCFVKPFLPVLVLALGFCFGTVRADSLERGGRWLSRKLMERHGALEEPFVYLQKIGVKTRPKMLSYGVSNEMLLFWDSGENVGKIQRLIDDRLTALSQALADNDFAGFKKELEAGSPSAGLYLGPGVRGRSGRNTTIFTAALEVSDLRFAETLLDWGASFENLDANYCIKMAGDDGIPKIRVLLKYGFDINTPNNSFGTPLAELVNERPDQTRAIEFLLKNRADANVKGFYDFPRFGDYTRILHLVVRTRPYRIIRFSPKEQQDQEPFEKRRERGREGALKLLLNYGANPNLTDSAGRTPLHIAVAEKENQKLVSLLLERGADPRIKDRSGRTAFDYAVGNKIKTMLRRWRPAAGGR